MNRPLQHNLFSGSVPFACLSGAALLIMASDRLAHAITAVGALLWIYSLSAIAAHTGARIFPRRGRIILLAFLTSFFAGAYILLLWILSPLCALESFFVISVIPMFFMMSDIFRRLESLSLKETLAASFSEALVLGALVIVIALIREPLGFLSLSLPGGARGIILLFSSSAESFLPVHLITSSCGALLLLGYFLGLYRYIEAKYTPPKAPTQEGKNGY